MGKYERERERASFYEAKLLGILKSLTLYLSTTNFEGMWNIQATYNLISEFMVPSTCSEQSVRVCSGSLGTTNCK